jgi:spermidine synthase
VSYQCLRNIMSRNPAHPVSGLGVGTTPAALVAHGIDTTVVEIDPVVHEFAGKYFQLPENHTPVIDDALMYTWKQSQDADGKRYDYIVHDVFTGGAEPIPLFTLEFLRGLDTLLKPNGVIAIVSWCGMAMESALSADALS